MKTINLLISIAFVSLFFVMISSCKKEVVTECPSPFVSKYNCILDSSEVFIIVPSPATPILSEEDYLAKLNNSVDIPTNDFTIDVKCLIYETGEVCISEIVSFQDLTNVDDLKSILEEDNWNPGLAGPSSNMTEVNYLKTFKITCSNGLFESISY